MVEKYGIGLDIGTSTLGWTSVDENGKIQRLKGQTALGTRLFNEGQTAEERRGFRTTRRRIQRRRWRLRLLREIFDEPIGSVDAGFFARQKMSSLSPQDDRFEDTYRLFNNQTDKAFHDEYPTTYHLRQALMNSDRQFDIREIYLAIYHIVKYRGNFLRSGKPADFKTGKLDLKEKFEEINADWQTLISEDAPQLPVDDLTTIKAVLVDGSRSRSDRQRGLVKLWMANETVEKNWKPVMTELAKAILGLKTKLYLLTGLDLPKEDQKAWTFSLDTLEDHQGDIDSFFDDHAQQLIDRLAELRAMIQLTEIIPSGLNFSQSMVQRYEAHRSHLEMYKQYALDQTDPKRTKALRAAYNAYIDQHEIADDFYTAVKRVTKDDQSETAEEINRLIGLEQFMPKQRTKENGVIPYQVHQQELDQIIAHQKKYYPFLGTENPVIDHRESQPYMLDELVSFRVPYYVGPMVAANPELKTTENPFAWMIRKAQGEITPWNFDEKVDRKGSATAFIERMKTTDTYLLGEDVLPQQSLLYQRFMVLNELNNIRIDDELLTTNQKQWVFDRVFKGKGTISAKHLQDALKHHGETDGLPKISGLADPTKFNSALTSYRDFQKWLPNDIDRKDRTADIETIINWSTVFEDTHIFVEKLKEIEWLTADQRRRIASNRYRGWGRLSKHLLTEIKDEQGLSIMDQLWRTQHNFMQIVHEPDYAKQIEAANTVGMAKQDIGTVINDLYTSPQNKKAIRQVLAVVKDIQNAHHGVAPSWIFMEAARGADQNPQRSRQRQRQLQDLYAKTAADLVDTEVQQELTDKIKDKANFTDRLMLYFLQNGQDMYSKEKLNIDRLSEYDIDHILPQALIKDDSLDNRVLVHQSINRNKSDTFASEKYGAKMQGAWHQWRAAGLISARKLRNLEMRPDEISKYATGFIRRQLVETRQVIKLVTEILSHQYNPEETKLVSVKAGLSHELRREAGLPKLRDLNDYHHAIDAYLAARIGTYLLKQYPRLERFFVYGQFQTSRLDLRRFNFIHDLVKSKQGVIVDSDTGEILWDRQKDIDYIKHLMGLKHLLVTHEVYDSAAEMYAQTIFKASDNDSKVLIPTKNDRPTAIYGGYTKRRNGYLAILKITEKKAETYRVVGVPTLYMSQLATARSHSVEAEKALLKSLMAPEILSESKVVSFEVVVSHVHLNQLVRDTVFGPAHYFGLGPFRYVRNFHQLVLPFKDQEILVKRTPTDEELNTVFEDICWQVENYFAVFDINGFRNALKKSIDKFEQLPIENVFKDKKLVTQGKKEVLAFVMQGLHANASYRNLKVSLGIKTPLGQLQLTKFMLSRDAELIDESPTGLFRRIRRLKDL